MAYEISATYRPSWIKRIAQYLREQYELDVLRSEIADERKSLASMSDHQLRDIGVTREQATQEALRGYGDIPDSRRRFLMCGC